MEIVTLQKFIHISPRKLRLVADMVRNLTPGQAVERLEFTQKSAAQPLYQAIKSALANAKNQGLDESFVLFKSIEINEGPRLKRFRAAARGRARPYRKKMSHIKIVLSDRLNTEKEKINTVRGQEAGSVLGGNVEQTQPAAKKLAKKVK